MNVDLPGEKKILYRSNFVAVMEVATGEYGEDKVKKLMSAVSDGQLEPFQEKFEQQKSISSGASTPSDHSSCMEEDDGDDTCEVKDLISNENGCCNGDLQKETLKNGSTLGSEVKFIIITVVIIIIT